MKYLVTATTAYPSPLRILKAKLSQRSPFAIVAVLVALFHFARLHAADELVIPNANATAPGNTITTFPMFSSLDLRMQQIFAGNQFPGPVRIVGVSFRYVGDGSFYVSTKPLPDVFLSTSDRLPDGLDAAFATNRGADVSQVFTRTSQTNFFSSAGGWGNEISFGTPFDYNPATGALLMETVGPGGSLGSVAHDAQETVGDSVSRIYSTTSTASAATTIHSRGVIVKFHHVPFGATYVNIAATDNSASEAGADPAVFTLTRYGPTTASLTVAYALDAVTNSVSASDIQPLSGTVTIPAGAATATITVTPIDDTEVEPLETIQMRLVAGAGYATGLRSAASANLADNEPAGVADLSGLTISSGNLSPVFAAGTVNYTASVPNAVASMTVTPAKTNANASIQVRINGGGFATVNSGSASSPLALNVGSNVIEVKVTAQDGITTKTYAVAVTRSAPPLPLGISLDTHPGRSWNSGGSQSWFGQSSITCDGVDAAQNGDINHSQESWIETPVTGPGTLTFRWKVSSEANYDFLRFNIDGVEQAGRISGSVDWTLKTFNIASGNHVLRWRYTKDSTADGGADTGWLDQVSFSLIVPTNATIETAGGIFESIDISNGGTRTLNQPPPAPAPAAPENDSRSEDSSVAVPPAIANSESISLPGAHGTYAGLFGSGFEDEATPGIAIFRITRGGRFTGFIKQNGRKHTLTGHLDSQGHFAGVARSRAAGLPVALQLDLAGRIPQVKGTIFYGGEVRGFLGYRLGVHRAGLNAAPKSRTYTIELVSPESEEPALSNGIETALQRMQVLRNGAVRFTGKLRSGRAVSSETRLTADSVWPFFVNSRNSADAGIASKKADGDGSR